jgi:pimeloyl-ACP methyl ester carboxylesterase
VSGTDTRTGYAPVGDLRMYYEVHGSGEPLVVLHGAYHSIEPMRPLVRGLAESRQVIAVELQGHGRTADIDRPLTYEHMADDTAGLLRHLGIDSAVVVGYSMGAAAALQLAIRHPAAVRKLVAISTAFARAGAHDVLLEMAPTVTPEMFAGSPIEEEYQRLAPNPGDFPALVEKIKGLDEARFASPEEDVRAITAPTLIVVGDSDAIRLEHVVEFFKLRGGGVMGDLTGLPASQLAVLPGTSHFLPFGSGMLDRVDWLLAMIRPFLDAPLPEPAS